MEVSVFCLQLLRCLCSYFGFWLKNGKNMIKYGKRVLKMAKMVKMVGYHFYLWKKIKKNKKSKKLKKNKSVIPKITQKSTFETSLKKVL